MDTVTKWVANQMRAGRRLFLGPQDGQAMIDPFPDGDEDRAFFHAHRAAIGEILRARGVRVQPVLGSPHPRPHEGWAAAEDPPAYLLSPGGPWVVWGLPQPTLSDQELFRRRFHSGPLPTNLLPWPWRRLGEWPTEDEAWAHSKRWGDAFGPHGRPYCELEIRHQDEGPPSLPKWLWATGSNSIETEGVLTELASAREKLAALDRRVLTLEGRAGTRRSRAKKSR